MKSKNLKSKLMISLFGIFTLGANAQVKIGVNPTTIDASAMLQIDVSQTSGSSKGFLLPRVPLTSLTDATTIASPATGLVVYATGGALAAGLYTWNGTAWVTYDATNDAWVNNPTNTRVELGTSSTGATRTTGTEFVARDNGNVGIGTATPGARLEVYRRGSSEAGNWIAHFGNSSPRVSLYEENMTFTRNGAATPNSGGGIFFSAANNAIIESSQGGIVLASRQANKNIGLHTYNPLQPLHVDGAQDNPGSGNPNATQVANDMVFNTSGQMGIGTFTPRSTLDVTGNPASTTAIDGIQAPRLTRDQLDAKGSIYTSNQKGALVYITVADPSTTPTTGSCKYIYTPGYYYFDGTNWVSNDLTNDAWVNNPTVTNPRVELGSQSNGLPREDGTLVVIGDDGNLGLGTTVPSARLSVYSSPSTPFAGEVIAHFGALDDPTDPVTGYTTNLTIYEEGDTRIRAGVSSDPLGTRIFFACNSDVNAIDAHTGSIAIVPAANQRLGLHTYDPLQILHLDAASDNPGSSGGTLSAAQSDDDFVVDNVGNVGIGLISPDSKLEVNGAITNHKSEIITGTTIDFSKSNLASTSSNATSITLNNFKDGGVYKLVMDNLPSSTGTVGFSASGFTFVDMGNVTRSINKRHIYTFVVIGTTVFVTMDTEN